MHIAQQTNARELLISARRIADQPPIDKLAFWSRGAALLARQSLEAAVKRYWMATVPGVEQTPIRTQLECLGCSLSNDALGDRAQHVWRILARASHPHRPNVTPTRKELLGLFDTVQEVIDATEGTRGEGWMR
jgi:hypothetical protein